LDQFIIKLKRRLRWDMRNGLAAASRAKIMSIDQQYKSQEQHLSKDCLDSSRKETHKSWFRQDTVDFWRHSRMYEPVKAFANQPGLSWITVGDGTYGLDSQRIRGLGFTSVLPTDLFGGMLQKALQEGLINDYRTENAEHLSLPDESFDLAFCKESYHHFPRGPVALHELLRVARHAVILIEPRDYCIDRPSIRSVGPTGLVKGLWTWLGLKIKFSRSEIPPSARYQLGDTPGYEESGNYIYSISSREMEKVALGLNLPALALKGMNDHYEAGMEHELATSDSTAFAKLQTQISTADEMSRAGIGSTSLLMVILFKTPPSTETREFLVRNEWHVMDLPRNPYL
jgi:SAM-dependent methyltransferase